MSGSAFWNANSQGQQSYQSQIQFSEQQKQYKAQQAYADSVLAAQQAGQNQDQQQGYTPTDTTIPTDPSQGALASPDPTQPLYDPSKTATPYSEHTDLASGANTADPWSGPGEDADGKAGSDAGKAAGKAVSGGVADAIASKVVAKAADALSGKVSALGSETATPDAYQNAALDAGGAGFPQPPRAATPAALVSPQDAAYQNAALDAGGALPSGMAVPASPAAPVIGGPPRVQAQAPAASANGQTQSADATGAAVLPPQAPTVGGTPRPLDQPDPDALAAGATGVPASQTAGIKGLPGSPSGPAAPRPALDTGSTPSLGGRILDALNPISSASAETIPGGPQPRNPQGKPALPMATKDGDTPIAANTPAVQTAAPAAKVAPNQAGPTDQTEATPTYVNPPFSPRAYVAAQQQNPQVADLYNKVAAATGVSPQRLALHHNVESGSRGQAPTSSTGAIGPMQIEPGTWSQVDPQHQYDIHTLPGALMVAGKYIHTLDRQFGQDTPASVASYNGGPGAGQKMLANKQIPAETQGYLAKCYPGQKLGPQNCIPQPTIDPAQMQQAMQGGPDTFIKYLAQVTPPGAPLGNTWKQAEMLGVHAALMKGDEAGAQAVQENVLQMSRQGASMALMNADRALAAGDGTTAAQQLARAHAFFPDGTMGRFGVDKSGNVWAQRISEQDPTMSLGKPFQVTRQSIQPQLFLTQDPNKYQAFVQQQQQQAAQIAFSQAHGKYFADAVGAREQIAEEANHTRETIAQGNQEARKQTAELAAQSRTDSAALRSDQSAKEAATRSAGLDKETDGYFGPTSQFVQNDPDGQIAGQASVVFRGLRGGGVAAPYAAHLGKMVATGQADLVRMQGSEGTAIRDKKGTVLAYLPPDESNQLKGYRQHSAPTSPANTEHQLGAGGALGYNPNSAALPPQNAPSTSALQ